MTENWIKWLGGDQPVDDYVPVEVRLRDGETWQGNAREFIRGRWEHSRHIGYANHIVAYRVSHD